MVKSDSSSKVALLLDASNLAVEEGCSFIPITRTSPSVGKEVMFLQSSPTIFTFENLMKTGPVVAKVLDPSIEGQKASPLEILGTEIPN